MTAFWESSPALARRLEGVVAIIDAEIAQGGFPVAGSVSAMARANGKLLRPALLVIGSMFGGSATPGRIDELAAAVELLHVATLIHDDILDDASTRRGLPSLHTSLGVKEAVLAGDWLLARSFGLAAASATPENARSLSRLMAAICSAEIEQDLGKFRFSTTVRGYFRTIAGKTASLFALALHAGSVEAKSGASISQALRRAGYCMGMAFQVVDDILDFESNEGEARKSVGRDIAEGLCTLPLIYALSEDSASMRALLPHRVASGTSAALAAASGAAALAVRLGGTERARRDARGFTARALSEIQKLPVCAARDELVSLADRLLARSY